MYITHVKTCIYKAVKRGTKDAIESRTYPKTGPYASRSVKHLMDRLFGQVSQSVALNSSEVSPDLRSWEPGHVTWNSGGLLLGHSCKAEILSR